MSKPKKKKIKILFKDGKVDVIPQKYWDDYECNYGIFIIKKNGEWVAFYSLDMIAAMVVG